jgi:hypothetical protein
VTGEKEGGNHAGRKAEGRRSRRTATKSWQLDGIQRAKYGYSRPARTRGTSGAGDFPANEWSLFVARRPMCFQGLVTSRDCHVSDILAPPHPPSPPPPRPYFHKPYKARHSPRRHFLIYATKPFEFDRA